MKKILGLLCFILVSFIAVSQPTGYPIPQSLGSTNTLVDSKGGTKLRPILYQYPDTATANNDNISRYPFAMIGIKDTVTDSGSIWYRSADTTQWLNIASGGSSSTNAWLIGGNNPASIVRPYLGTTGNKELIFITNNRERLGIPAVGIVQRYTGVEKMLLYDTTTKYMYWHDVYNTQVSSSLCTDTIRYYIGDSLVSQVQVDRQNGLNSGGLVVLSGGTSYFVDSAIYTIACERFSTPQFTVTLSPNTGSSNPRIDVIGLNNLGSGSAFVLEGTPSPNPQTPSVDPAQQIGLVSVYFPANSDTATVINIYNNYVFNGTDSSAIHTVLVSSDSTQMYFCDLYGACDTVELVQTGGGGGTSTGVNGLNGTTSIGLGGITTEDNIQIDPNGLANGNFLWGSNTPYSRYDIISNVGNLVNSYSFQSGVSWEGDTTYLWGALKALSLPKISSITSSVQQTVIDTSSGIIYRKTLPLVYKAILTQSGTNNPTVVSELENDFGVTPTISRFGTGTYSVAFTDLLDATKTISYGTVTADDDAQSPKIGSFRCISTDEVIVTVVYPASGSGSDNNFISITIERYP